MWEEVEQGMQAGHTGREREAVAMNNDLPTVPFFACRTNSRVVPLTTFIALYGDWVGLGSRRYHSSTANRLWRTSKNYQVCPSYDEVTPLSWAASCGVELSLVIIPSQDELLPESSCTKEALLRELGFQLVPLVRASHGGGILTSALHHVIP